MLKQQHYTLTNVKKVKSQSTTPLKGEIQYHLIDYVYFCTGKKMKLEYKNNVQSFMLNGFP